MWPRYCMREETGRKAQVCGKTKSVGDAVNIAARMCSYSAAGHVHVSDATYQLVKSRFAGVCRGERKIKGKGDMKTYWLVNLPADQLEVLLEYKAPASPAGRRASNQMDADAKVGSRDHVDADGRKSPNKGSLFA